MDAWVDGLIDGQAHRLTDRQAGRYGRYLECGHGDQDISRLDLPALLSVGLLHEVVDHHALPGHHLLEGDAERLGQRHLGRK
tara:strand:+ start:464 stop:709 length:246 start_codon:yes stop_codon:yes gene_type:complete